MPELPEVETVVSGLKKVIMGKRIKHVDELRAGTVINDLSVDKADLGVIRSISRRGKYIRIETDYDINILIHLRMTGRLFYGPIEAFKADHIRAIIRFTEGENLYFDDIRTFGTIRIHKAGESIPALLKLGPEPLSEDFNEKYLSRITRKRKAPIKNILLDQTVVAGLGNIYVSEILFRAGVVPTIPGEILSVKALEGIVFNTKEIIREAIKLKGTTISDYAGVNGESGKFQSHLRIYGKKICHCGAEIKKIKIGGRSSYYCPCCQKDIGGINDAN